MNKNTPEHVDKRRATGSIKLRDIIESDLEVFFLHQLDSDANYMAAFTARDPKNREAFDAQWRKILADETITGKTILFNGHVAGHVASHGWSGKPEVTYWIGKEYWGKGIATRALSGLLEVVKTRPMFARVARDNIASIRVLEKCGFSITGKDKGFSNARGEEVEEFIMKLG